MHTSTLLEWLMHSRASGTGVLVDASDFYVEYGLDILIVNTFKHTMHGPHHTACIWLLHISAVGWGMEFGRVGDFTIEFYAFLAKTIHSIRLTQGSLSVIIIKISLLLATTTHDYSMDIQLLIW